MAYRADIDGLRALAVTVILLFHFGVPGWRGGYLGVDIFFVISGFLITTIIQRELATGQFTIGGFYKRRVRRILPAMLAMLVVVLAAGFVLLLPYDLIDLAWNSLATLFFNANNYQLFGAGYFARSSELKPLTHMWSLGVEEQFYLFFPLVMMFLSRFRRPIVIGVIALAVAGSWFAYTFGMVMGAYNYVFFLIPTRAWELGAGSLIALVQFGRAPAASRPVLATAMSVVGIAAIAVGIAFDAMARGWLQPSTFAVIGTVLLIVSLDRGSWLRPLFAAAPVVFVGALSYSLYIWHWPIVAMLRYWLVREPTGMEYAGAALATVILAYLSWRFIEEPFRKRTMPFRTIARVCIVASLTVIIASTAIILGKGFVGRFDAKAVSLAASVDGNYRCSILDYVPVNGSRGCRMNLPGDAQSAQFALLGNSHAQMYAPVFRDMLIERDVPGVLVSSSFCVPSLGANISAACVSGVRRDIENIAALPNVRTVVLAFNWDYRRYHLIGDPLPVDQMLVGVDQTIARLREAGKAVVLLGPLAQPGYDFASVIGRRLAYGRPLEQRLAEPRAEFDRWATPIIAHYQSRKDVTFIRPDQVQCDAVQCSYAKGDTALFSDDNHLAERALPLFAPMFRQQVLPLIAAGER